MREKKNNKNQPIIKYRYALDRNSEIIDINSLTDECRYEKAPYKCLSCSGELIARLGKKKVKHFAHKNIAECSPETYLHQLAKLTFFREYKKCLSKGDSFLLRRTVIDTCNFCEEALGITCPVHSDETINLAEFFEIIELETEYGGFIPDILLSSARHEKVLFIEFAVTHSCDGAKKNSGNRILELKIEIEDDLSQITQHSIDETHGKNILYNFKHRRVVNDFYKGDCDLYQWYLYLFIVHKSGKSILTTISPKAAVSMKNSGDDSRFLYSDIFRGSPFNQQDTFQHCVERAYFDGVKVKNCILCRYHGFSMQEAVFCKFRKEHLESNSAADCEYYRPVKSRKELEEVKEAISKYLKEH